MLALLLQPKVKADGASSASVLPAELSRQHQLVVIAEVVCRTVEGLEALTATSHAADMAASGNAASSLLDFKQPFNVDLLDTTIKAFYGAGSNQEVRTPSD